jgi:hypothetical protein
VLVGLEGEWSMKLRDSKVVNEVVDMGSPPFQIFLLVENRWVHSKETVPNLAAK